MISQQGEPTKKMFPQELLYIAHKFYASQGRDYIYLEYKSANNQKLRLTGTTKEQFFNALSSDSYSITFENSEQELPILVKASIPMRFEKLKKDKSAFFKVKDKSVIDHYFKNPTREIFNFLEKLDFSKDLCEKIDNMHFYPVAVLADEIFVENIS